MSRKEIEYLCPHCGNNKSFINKTPYSEAGECTKCGDMTFYHKNPNRSFPNPILVIECPYCHSTNTSKITTTSKVGSVALFGIFAAGKVAKEWHCNTCKSDF